MNKEKRVKNLTNPVKSHIGYLISMLFSAVPLLLKYLTNMPEKEPKLMIALTIMFVLSATLIIITILILNFLYHFKQLKVIEEIAKQELIK